LYGAYYGQAHYKSTGVGDAVLSMVTSPAGDTVAVATPKGGVTLLKPTGKPIQVGAVEGPARATAFSPDGALIAFGTDTAIAVYTVDRKLRARATLHSVGVTDVAFGRDSSSVFVATRYRGIYRFDLATQTPAIFTGASGDGLLDGTLSVAVSPDGPHVAASFADGQIRVWNLDGQPVGAWKSDRGAASHVVFVREGQRLLAGHVGGRVCLWSLDGKLHDCVEAARSIDAFAVSPDGKSFVTADDDFTAKYWTLPETDRFDSSARVELRGHTNRVRGIAFDTKGRVLTGSYDGTLRRWQFAQPRTIAAGNSLRRFAVFSPVDANRLLTNGGYNTVLVDLDGRIVKEFPNPPAEYQVAVTAAAYAPAGDFVLTGSYGGSLALWRIDGALIWRRHVGGEISAVLFDPESKTAYAALKASSRDWHVLRFDWERFTKPNVVLVTHRRINGVAVASSGDIIVTAEGGNNGTDGQILIHRRGQTLKSIIVDRDQPRAVVFSPDRHLLLLGADLQTPAERGTTAGFVRHSASVLDESFNEVMVLGGHLRMVTSAAFSSDGKYVLTGSGESNLPDAEMRLWTAGGVLLFAAAADKDVAAVAFSPAGSHIAAAAGPDLKLWLMARALRRHLDTLDIDIE
jgi:WD40 repeat protein